MRAFFAAGAIVSLLLVAGIGTSSAETCQELLGDNFYRCTFKVEGDTAVACVLFDSSSPSFSDRFDMFVQSETNAFGCTCNAAGSVENPDFGASRDFLCAGVVEVGGVAAIEGTVKNGKKIKNGQIWVNPPNGLSARFECKLDPSCGGSETVTAEKSGANEGVE